MNTSSASNTEVVSGAAIGPALGSEPPRGSGGRLRPTLTIAHRCAPAIAPVPVPGASASAGEGIPVRTKRSRALPSEQRRILSALLESAHTAPNRGHASWR